jgi:hypothetical protein
MVSKSALRWLVALEIFLAIFGAIVERLVEFDGSFWNRDIRVPANSAFGGTMTWSQLILGSGLILIGLIAYVGIIRFWRPARRLYLLYHILGLAALPLSGPSTKTGWGSVFSGAGYAVTGFILALLFFTPLKEHFKKRKADPHAPYASSSSPFSEETYN